MINDVGIICKQKLKSKGTIVIGYIKIILKSLKIKLKKGFFFCKFKALLKPPPHPPEPWGGGKNREK